MFNKSLLKLSGHEFRLALPKTNGLISGFRKSHVKLREQKHLSQLTCRFPGSTTKGCFFHFNRAILQKAQYTGLLIPSETTLVRHAANLFHAPLDIVYDIWLTPWKTEMKPTFLNDRTICLSCDRTVSYRWLTVVKPFRPGMALVMIIVMWRVRILL